MAPGDPRGDGGLGGRLCLGRGKDLVEEGEDRLRAGIHAGEALDPVPVEGLVRVAFEGGQLFPHPPGPPRGVLDVLLELPAEEGTDELLEVRLRLVVVPPLALGDHRTDRPEDLERAQSLARRPQADPEGPGDIVHADRLRAGVDIAVNGANRLWQPHEPEQPDHEVDDLPLEGVEFRGRLSPSVGCSFRHWVQRFQVFLKGVKPKKPKEAKRPLGGSRKQELHRAKPAAVNGRKNRKTFFRTIGASAKDPSTRTPRITDHPVLGIAGAWDAVAAPNDGGAGRLYAQCRLGCTIGEPTEQPIALGIWANDSPLEVRAVYPVNSDLRTLSLRIRAHP